MKKTPKWISVLRGLGFLIGVVIVLIYIGLPAAMGVVTVFPTKAGVGSVPEGFSEVTLLAKDGIQIKGWYRPPAAGDVILLVHGAGGSRESMRPYADVLVKHGYGVLMVDLRGHGQSQGKTNRLGWQGTLDVGAAVQFLRAQKEVKHIGGLGSSMGGEVLLGAASAYPEIQAIVADGATRRSLAEYLALEVNRPLTRNFTARVWFAIVQLLSGDPPPLPLLDSIRQTEATQFMLIAAGNNVQEISFNQLFADTLGSRATLWVVPGVDHTGAFSIYPAEYEQRVIDFFHSALSQ